MPTDSKRSPRLAALLAAWTLAIGAGALAPAADAAVAVDVVNVHHRDVRAAGRQALGAGCRGKAQGREAHHRDGES